MNAADMCRANNWQVGDILEGTESGKGWSSTDRIQITAIGERHVLAINIWRNGKEIEHPREGSWALDCREWKKHDGPATDHNKEMEG